MRKLLLGALLLLCMLSFGQVSNYEYKKEINCLNTKDKSFDNILIWIVESFNDPNSVIKLKDKESGIIIIKGIIDNGEFKTSMTIRITFIDNKCIVLIKDWKETNYGYTQYKDISNCYTKQCKKNVLKWSNCVDNINDKMLSEITLILSSN